MKEFKPTNNKYETTEESFMTKFNRISEPFFKMVDEKSGTFYLIIALVCFIVFVIAMVYSINKITFNKESGIYIMKSKGKTIELKLEKENPYLNKFLTDTEEGLIKKENELSSLIYTDTLHYEETDNIKIKANLPKLNISSELNNKEIEKIKDKIVEVNNRISTVRTIFEGNNQLDFDYYASYYQNTLSFGYSYYENINNAIVSDKNSLVYDANRNKMITFGEYIRSRGISESKLSDGIKEIFRLEKLKYKYNKKTKTFYVDPKGVITLVLNDKYRIKITIK